MSASGCKLAGVHASLQHLCRALMCGACTLGECQPRMHGMSYLQSHRCAYPPYVPDAATLVVCAVALASTMWTAHVDAKGTKKKDSGNRGKCDTCKQIVKVGGAHVHTYMHRTHAHTTLNTI